MLHLPANRVAVIVSVLTSIVTIAAAVAGAFPGRVATALVVVAALATKALTVLKFLEGAQRAEARTAVIVAQPYVVNPNANATAATNSLLWRTPAGDPEGPGDPDALPHLPVADPAIIPADGVDFPRTVAS